MNVRNFELQSFGPWSPQFFGDHGDVMDFKVLNIHNPFNRLWIFETLKLQCWVSLYNMALKAGYNRLQIGNAFESSFVLWGLQLLEIRWVKYFFIDFLKGKLQYHLKVCPFFNNDQWLTIVECCFLLFQPNTNSNYNITRVFATILQYHPFFAFY